MCAYKRKKIIKKSPAKKLERGCIGHRDARDTDNRDQTILKAIGLLVKGERRVRIIYENEEQTLETVKHPCSGVRGKNNALFKGANLVFRQKEGAANLRGS